MVKYLEIGKIVNTFGIRGQVKVMPFTDDIKRFDKLKANAPKKEENKKIHNGIHCNGCGMNPIVGNRFKCSICDNFDFCEKCENLNKDKHLHPFIKIYSPQVAPIEIKCELK